jgi:hypothetical protein
MGKGRWQLSLGIGLIQIILIGWVPEMEPWFAVNLFAHIFLNPTIMPIS